ncbi:hypothetical protein MUY14_21590 [Amycolatopsis sp. FBCC-B4732]|uniref:hypothetical protein n=1 Tax=Amycolatopsis sp. FBCC-B4732 TaxID=3079339 RepID=UPI001FF4A0BF|nr:hypothetical protein [Amycolatopsis sp. FBCC-B4732]UOX93082.1 hypothetical protein MUY14_21590 [Amycolatopsis sp. FBCC-B4732]
MLRSPWQRRALLAAPGLLLAGFGVVHPGQLDAASASWWAALHVVLLPVFPLLAVAQWSLLTPAPPWLRWPGRLAAFGFAAFYGGLDAVAGIAAGTVVHAQHGATPVVGAVFAAGDRLGYVGSACFLVASVLIVVAAALRVGWRAAPGAVVLLLASVSFVDSHIFWPRGVFTMVGVAVGMFLLAPAEVPVRDR